MVLNLPEKLSGYPQKQSDFLIAMLDTGIISEAAKRAHITEATAHKWLNNGLDKVLKEMRAELIDEALNKLQLACTFAVDTLLEILSNKENPLSIRLKASTFVLDATFKIREQEQIIDRLDALEERIDEDD